MAAASARLTFSGVDGVEAEDFLYHVRQKALADGKLQDKQWLINFTSSCLVRDALRWHATLDTQVQDDWDRFQKALLLRFRTIFHGVDGEECEKFVAHIRQIAYDNGKATDNDWIVAYVGASLASDALRWHANSEIDVQSDWVLLQRAMFVKYPPPETRSEPTHLRTPSYTVPIPAAATDFSLTRSRKGRIRVSSEDGTTVLGYISNSYDPSGYVSVTPNRGQAMELKYTSSTSAHALDITDASSTWTQLGVRWVQPSPVLQASTSDHGYLSGVRTDSNGTQTSWKGGGPAVTAMWRISSDGAISMSWTDLSGQKHVLVPHHIAGSGIIFVTGLQSAQDAVHAKAKFTFEAT